MISITTLCVDNTSRTSEVALLLLDGFRGISDAWPDTASAHHEVVTNSTSTHVSLIACVDEAVVGWVAANPQYDGHAWELHPLVVASAFRRRGIARALVTTLCAQVKAKGATTLFVWCDDEGGYTSLADTSLYPDPLVHVAQFSATSPHAAGFYLKLGFSLCGVLPDANGIGKPDILFSRRV